MSMMANCVSGNSAATFFIAASIEKPVADDRIVAVAGEIAERLLALRIVLDLEIGVFGAGLRLESLGAVIGGLVEALVEFSAEVIDERRLRPRGPARQVQAPLPRRAI